MEATPGEAAVRHEPAIFDAVLHWSSLGLEAAGVAVVVFGALLALAMVLAGLGRGADRSELYHDFRSRLARSILLGLEFLVAADIIGTVAVEPTVDNLLVLGLIVLIRTFLSFSLEVEIEGRWPWRRGPREPDRDAASSR
jgi:uncharacterized membrane protein